jgi:hypothetical protein
MDEKPGRKSSVMQQALLLVAVVGGLYLFRTVVLPALGVPT